MLNSPCQLVTNDIKRNKRSVCLTLSILKLWHWIPAEIQMLEVVGSHNICLARHFRTSSFCVFFFLACIEVYFVLSLYLQVRRSVENNATDSAYESTTGNTSGVDDNTEHSKGKIYFYSCCWSSGINLIWVLVISHLRKGISDNWGRKDWSKVCSVPNFTNKSP